MKKKLAALCLTLALCLGLAVPAMAADTVTIDGVSITNVVSSESITISIQVLSDDPVTEITGTLYHLEPNATINAGSETAGLISLEPDNGVYVSSDLGGAGQMGESWTVPAPSAEETAAGVICQLITSATDRNIFYVADGGTAASDTAETPAETAPAASPFSDVATTSNFYPGILWAAEQEITKGYNDGTFRPNATCTNAQILTFLWRASDFKYAVADGLRFSNLTGSEYYYDAAVWAVSNALTDDDPSSEIYFDASKPCTRAMTVEYLWRAAGCPLAAESSSFTDVDESSENLMAIDWAVEQGITKGTGDGTTFSPDATCTRGQIATFLYRYYVLTAAQTAG